MAGPNKTKRHIPWIRWLGTLVSLGLLIYWLADHGLQSILESLKSLPWVYFLLAMLLVLLSRLAVCGRWYVLLRGAQLKVTPWEAVRLVFSGLFASNFLPTTIGGDVVRFVASVRMNLNASVVAASLVMDRLVGMLGMATTLPIGLVMLFNGQQATSQSLLTGMLLATPLTSNWQKWKHKGFDSLRSLLQAVKLWITHPLSLVIALALTWAHMLFQFTATWILLSGMGETISLWQIAGIWSMSYFITLLPISVNGLGVQEISMSFLFANYGHITMPNALTLSILFRTMLTLASLPGAAFLPMVSEKKIKPEPEDQQIRED
jgi:hypothetical protein